MNGFFAVARQARITRPRIGLRWECRTCASHGATPGICRLCGRGTMSPLLSTCPPLPSAPRRRA